MWSGERGNGIIKSLLMELVIDGTGKISNSGGFDYYCRISTVSKDSGGDGDVR